MKSDVNKFILRICEITICIILITFTCMQAMTIVKLNTKLNSSKREYIYVEARRNKMYHTIRVPMIEIIGNSEKFNEKSIEFDGVLWLNFNLDDEGYASDIKGYVFLSKESFDNMSFKESVELNSQFVEDNIENLINLNGGFVRVTGIYESKLEDNIHSSGKVKYVTSVDGYSVKKGYNINQIKDMTAEVIQNPEEYYDKAVMIKGILYIDSIVFDEDKRDEYVLGRVFFSQDAYENMIVEESISIDSKYILANAGRLYSMSGKQISIYGTFEKNMEHHSLGVGKIKNVSYLTEET